MQRAIGPAVLATAMLLAGCAPATPQHYQWDGYQHQVYAYFKGATSPREQIAALDKAQHDAGATGRPAPPGLHAHLGMLYALDGDAGQAVREWENEKTLFPESTPYMDFLMKKNAAAQTTAQP